MTPEIAGNAPAGFRPPAAGIVNSASGYSPAQTNEYVETSQNRSGFHGLIACVAIVAGLLLASQHAYAKCLPTQLVPQIITYSLDGAEQVWTIEELTSPWADYREDEAFVAFVQNVSNRLSKDSEDALGCSRFGAVLADIQAKFVYVPLTIYRIRPEYLEHRLPADGQCKVESPWLQLVYQGGTRPRVSATFIWNERQALLDQANISDSTAKAISVAPLSAAMYDYLGLIYTHQFETENSAPSGTLPLSEVIPPDILWFFKRVINRDSIPFRLYAQQALETVMRETVSRQSDLALKLASLCLDNSKKLHEFRTIQDVGGFVNLKEYRLQQINRSN